MDCGEELKRPCSNRYRHPHEHNVTYAVVRLVKAAIAGMTAGDWTALSSATDADAADGSWRRGVTVTFIEKFGSMLDCRDALHYAAVDSDTVVTANANDDEQLLQLVAHYGTRCILACPLCVPCMCEMHLP